MPSDRSSVYIGLADLLLACLSVVIVAVAPPSKAKGPEQPAEFMITADWPVTGPNSDSDVDLWTLPPSGNPIMYKSRQIGCGSLDRDSRGWTDSRVNLPHGVVKIVDSQRETTAFRCIEPGHFDVGVHLYSYHWHEGDPTGAYGLRVHVEVVRINPVLKTVWQGDVVINADSQFVNAVSFDLEPDGIMTVTDTPLEPWGARFMAHE